MLSGRAKPELVLRLHNVTVGSFHNLALVVWRALPSMEAAVEIGRRYRAMADRKPAGFAVLIVVENNVAVPPEPVRRTITGMIQTIGSHVVAMATVHEATGFYGAAIRSVVTAMSIVTRDRFARRIFSNADDAAIWLAPYVIESAERPVLSREISAALREIREPT